MNTSPEAISRIEPGDTVRLRGTDVIGRVVAVRTIAPSGHVAAKVYWGVSVAWKDRTGRDGRALAPTWHAYAGVELVSKS